MVKSYFDDPTSLIDDFPKDVDVNSLDFNDWADISYSYRLSVNFLEKYLDKVHWYYISMCQILPLDFIEKHQDKVNWCYISAYQTLPMTFIEKFKDKVVLTEIITHQNLPIYFIEKHKNTLDFNYLSIYQNLPENFIKKHQHKMNWDYISKYQNVSKFSDRFMTKFQDKLNTKELISRKYRHISAQEYAKKHNLKIKDGYLYAYRYHDQRGRGAFKLNSHYKKGVYYKDWHCDTNPNNSCSFGFGILPEGNTPVRIKLEDWGTAVYSNYRRDARVWGFEII